MVPELSFQLLHQDGLPAAFRSLRRLGRLPRDVRTRRPLTRGREVLIPDDFMYTAPGHDGGGASPGREEGGKVEVLLVGARVEVRNWENLDVSKRRSCDGIGGELDLVGGDGGLLQGVDWVLACAPGGLADAGLDGFVVGGVVALGVEAEEGGEAGGCCSVEFGWGEGCDGVGAEGCPADCGGRDFLGGAAENYHGGSFACPAR